MPILNPDHLIEQSERLIAPPPAGPPRQVDLRRAVSSAYYALFHLTLTALADEMIGAANRSSQRYALVHRGIDHRALKDLCLVLSKTTVPPRFAPFIPAGFFGRDFLVYAGAVVALQNERHRADYDVTARYKTSSARSAIAQSRRGITAFRGIEASRKKMFLTLLLCPPR